MANEQDRIRDLVTYTQLDASDPDYVNPASIYFALDSVNFASKALKYSFEDILGGASVEKDRLTGLSSRSVSVTFGTAFSSVPITVTLNVYRMLEVVSGKYVRKDVQYYHSSASWLTTTGFSLEIETSESLTGIIVEYRFEEA